MFICYRYKCKTVDPIEFFNTGPFYNNAYLNGNVMTYINHLKIASDHN